MIEDKATEKLKKRAQDLGLIVNASADEKPGTIASQTATTRRLNEAFRKATEAEQQGGKK